MLLEVLKLELEQLMVKALAKRKGIPEEQAQAFLEAIKGTDEYEELKASLARLVDTGQIVQQLPAQMQPLAMPLMMTMVQNRGSSAEKIAERVAMISAAIKAAYGDDSSKLIEDLRREIQELKEEKEKKEMERMLSETIKAFQEYVARLEERIAQLEGNSRRAEEDEGDEIDKLERYLAKIEETKEKLKRLGLVKDAEDDPDVAKAAEILRRMGYRVEPPPSYEQMRRMLEEELKKREEELRKKIEQELGIQEKKMTMAMELAMALIDGIVSAAAGRNTEGGAISQFMGMARQLLGAGGMMGGGAGEVGSGGSGAVEANTPAGGDGEQAG
jgi:superfamily I DNA/RNA helicase